MEMMSPTVRMVACLARYRSADDVLAVARKRLAYKRIRVNNPDGEYQVLLPGEDGYEEADLEVESGWVRLWEPPRTSLPQVEPAEISDFWKRFVTTTGRTDTPQPDAWPFGDSVELANELLGFCLLYTSPSPRDATLSRMPSSA